MNSVDYNQIPLDIPRCSHFKLFEIDCQLMKNHCLHRPIPDVEWGLAFLFGQWGYIVAASPSAMSRT